MAIWQLAIPFCTGDNWVGDTYLGDAEVEVAVDEIDLGKCRGVPIRALRNSSVELLIHNPIYYTGLVSEFIFKLSTLIEFWTQVYTLLFFFPIYEESSFC